MIDLKHLSSVCIFRTKKLLNVCNRVLTPEIFHVSENHFENLDTSLNIHFHILKKMQESDFFADITQHKENTDFMN